MRALLLILMFTMNPAMADDSAFADDELLKLIEEPTEATSCDGDCKPSVPAAETVVEQALAIAGAAIDGACAFTDGDAAFNSLRAANCRKVLLELKSSGMRESAFLFTLETFKNLSAKRFDMKCAVKAQDSTPEMKNKCQFVVNDLSQLTSRPPVHQNKAYFIDLCAGSPHTTRDRVVEAFDMNRAKNSNSNKVGAYSDRRRAYKQAVGAQLIGNRPRQFTP
ncbi:MAG TPA: hypothetical protein PKC28_16845, partial [Bdellovibrionales bacterium]|nr:hypothetical protein [Bdellovibrionales bacterium]